MYIVRDGTDKAKTAPTTEIMARQILLRMGVAYY